MEISEGLKQVESPLVSFLVKRSLEALVADFSFFAFGPVSFIASRILTTLFTRLIDEGIIATEFAEIDSRVDKEKSALDRAQDAAKDTSGMTEEQKKKVQDDLIKAAKDFIRIRK